MIEPGSEIQAAFLNLLGVQMKSETDSRKDDLVQNTGELAGGIQKLAREAVHEYSAEVEAILKVKSRDSGRIERCLDGMLDFCFDDEMLVFYKKLCRYYIDIDPEATASYVRAYREMWDEQKPAKGSPVRET
jgi:hypothetical protein